jgi:hypothetical protein
MTMTDDVLWDALEDAVYDEPSRGQQLLAFVKRLRAREPEPDLVREANDAMAAAFGAMGVVAHLLREMAVGAVGPAPGLEHTLYELFDNEDFMATHLNARSLARAVAIAITERTPHDPTDHADAGRPDDGRGLPPRP